MTDSERFDEIKLALQIADRIAENYGNPNRMAAIAEACDKVLDRSGNLLGWIRDYVALKRKAKP